MKEIFSIRGLDIFQKNFQQVVLRSKGGDKFKEIINKETSLLPPSSNLTITSNDSFLFAKHSFDQWNLFYLEEKKHQDVLKFVSTVNSDEEILASDYSYGQVYFEISGEKSSYYLNKLTHFDLREKKFPISTMAQTLIAKIDCSIYHLKDKYLITCNSSFEDYFRERLLDSVNV
jgi:heterotetrameric sarcosine oxidase gamma subunit|tara:strand:- start:46 stop:567 length:522 start_codon:yes stop_codon:yes gene_type:complete